MVLLPFPCVCVARSQKESNFRFLAFAPSVQAPYEVRRACKAAPLGDCPFVLVQHKSYFFHYALFSLLFAQLRRAYFFHYFLPSFAGPTFFITFCPASQGLLFCQRQTPLGCSYGGAAGRELLRYEKKTFAKLQKNDLLSINHC
jgi:hypothetical protein